MTIDFRILSGAASESSSLNKSPDPHSIVERLELHAVCIAPLGSKSGEERWEAARALREAATIISDLQAERDRIERNRDMWKGQCERQAASLTTMRDLLTRVDGLGRTNAWRRMPTGGSFNATALGQDIASAIRSSLTNVREEKTAESEHCPPTMEPY